MQKLISNNLRVQHVIQHKTRATTTTKLWNVLFLAVVSHLVAVVAAAAAEKEK